MKTNILKTIRSFSLAGVLCVASAILFGGCEKESLEGEKAMHILINGYNGGDSPLEVAIDTTVFDASFNNGASIIKAQSNINFATAFSYKTPKKRLVTLTDTVTRKVVYSAELPTDAIRVNFNYLYFDGKVQELTIPIADPNTNKLGFYIHDTDIDYPIDIFLQRVDPVSGQVFEEYIAKNVIAGKWIYVDYLPGKNFNKQSDMSSSTVNFTKANTTTEWAFENNESKSKLSASGFFLPVLSDQGKVQPYFIAPKATDQTFSRLFFYLN